MQSTLIITEKTREIVGELMIPTTRVDGFAKLDGKGFAGAMVILVPENPALHTDRSRLDQTDSDGSFALNSVAPGHYTLLAIADAWQLEDGMEIDWENPAVLAPYLSNGVKLDLPEHAGEVFPLPAPIQVQPLLKKQ